MYFMRFLCDVFLEDLGLCRLWIPKIHHLVEEFVDDHKVIPDTFFFEFFEIFGEDFDETVQEEKDLGGIRVRLSEGEEVEVVVSNVEVL